ncbi:hypothetical protein LCGC14_0564020 [marine sediment metagenome]|uniref:Uncharacterized protein n=1 Tax=marine sediment metagenome TaxID=412755 RepID=A0A0F9RRI5_9ZZZZ
MTLEIINFSVDIALLIYKLFRQYSKSKSERDLNNFLSQINVKFKDLTNNEDFAEIIFLHGIPPLLVKYQKEKKFKRKFQKFYDVFNDVQAKYHLESVIDDWNEKFKIIYQKYGLYNSYSFKQLNEYYKKEIEKIQEEIKSKKYIHWKAVKDIIMRRNFNLYFWYYTKPVENFSTKENYDKYRTLLKQIIMDELKLELNLDETLDFFINDLLEENIDEFIPFSHFENISLISSILNKKISSKDMLYKGFIDDSFYSILNEKYHQETISKDTLIIIEKGIKSYKKVFHPRKTVFLKNFLKDINDDLYSILDKSTDVS